MYKYLILTLATLAGFNAIAETEIQLSRSVILTKVLSHTNNDGVKAGTFETSEGSNVNIWCNLVTAGYPTGEIFTVSENGKHIFSDHNNPNCASLALDIMEKVKGGSKVKLTFFTPENPTLAEKTRRLLVTSPYANMNVETIEPSK